MRTCWVCMDSYIYHANLTFVYADADLSARPFPKMFGRDFIIFFNDVLLRRTRAAQGSHFIRKLSFQRIFGRLLNNDLYVRYATHFGLFQPPRPPPTPRIFGLFEKADPHIQITAVLMLSFTSCRFVQQEATARIISVVT